MHKHAVAPLLALACAAAIPAHAATIAGPITSFGSVTVSGSVSTPNPNNDDVTGGPSPNTLNVSENVTSIASPFGFVFSMPSSAGATEYFVTKTITNSTSETWTSLSVGLNSTASPPSQNDFPLDLDNPIGPSITGNGTAGAILSILGQDYFTLSGLSIAPGDTVTLSFGLDTCATCSGGWIIHESATGVPEPSTLALMLAAGIPLFIARRKAAAARNLASLALVLTASASAGVISLTNNTTGNFDNSSGTRTVTVTGSEPGYGNGVITGVRIGINFAKADGESYTPPFPTGTPYYNEIVFQLTSPSATTVTLIAPNSWSAGSGQFDGTILFDDAAAQVVNAGSAPAAGTFRPTGAGALADFIGESAAGTWSLFIQDTVSADSLRFREYTLEITTDAPEPASTALLGLGLAGLGVWRRRTNPATRG